MSQTSELLSDDDTASGVTFSDKDMERGKFERQHTEMSELSDDSFLTYQPLIPNDNRQEAGLVVENQLVNNGEIQCSCDNCREESLQTMYENQQMIADDGECMCENCVKSRQYIQYEGTSHRNQGHWQAQGHWTGISISDDDIEIITDSNYYHDKNVFYIDPSVARSLLSEFLVRENPQRANLQIHVDSRTKRQKFVARAVMIVSMTMFTVSALLVMVSLIMSDKIDDLVRGNNNLLQKHVLSSTPPSAEVNLTDVITNLTAGPG